MNALRSILIVLLFCKTSPIVLAKSQNQCEGRKFPWRFARAVAKVYGPTLLVLLFAAQAVALDFSQSVGIVNVKVTARESNSGSCCVFAIENGLVYISTAGHITDGREAAYVEFRPGGKTGYHYPAVVVAQSKNGDWAVLTVEASKFVGWKPIPIRPIQPGQKVAIGSKIYFAGYGTREVSRTESVRLPLRAGVGTITGKTIGPWVECSTAFDQGESGGPVISVIDGTPRLIGIIVIETGTTGGFTPINLAADGWRQRETAYRFCQWRSECPDCENILQPAQRRQQQPQGDRLPSWIVPGVPDPVPDPPDELAPVGPETPIPSYPINDPNIPDDVAEMIMPNGPKRPVPTLPDAKLLEMWRAEAERAVRLEARLEAANQAAAELKALDEAAKDKPEPAPVAEPVAPPLLPIPDTVLNPIPPVEPVPVVEPSPPVVEVSSRTWPQWIESQGWIATLLALGSWAIWAGRGAIERRRARKGGA